MSHSQTSVFKQSNSFCCEKLQQKVQRLSENQCGVSKMEGASQQRFSFLDQRQEEDPESDGPPACRSAEPEGTKEGRSGRMTMNVKKRGRNQIG